MEHSNKLHCQCGDDNPKTSKKLIECIICKDLSHLTCHNHWRTRSKETFICGFCHKNRYLSIIIQVTNLFRQKQRRIEQIEREDDRKKFKEKEEDLAFMASYNPLRMALGEPDEDLQAKEKLAQPPGRFGNSMQTRDFHKTMVAPFTEEDNKYLEENSHLLESDSDDEDIIVKY